MTVTYNYDTEYSSVSDIWDHYPRAFRRKSGDYVIPFAVRPSVRLPFDRPLSPPRLLKLES